VRNPHTVATALKQYCRVSTIIPDDVCTTWANEMRGLFRTKQNKTKQNKTKQNKTKQNKTKQNKTKQNKEKKEKKSHVARIVRIEKSCGACRMAWCTRQKNHLSNSTAPIAN
jgi:hypothetical protein